MSDRAKNI